MADAALGRGWSVTVLNSGTLPQPPGAEVLLGDRTTDAGLALLGSGTWDVVVDTWSGAPSVVRDATRLLRERAGHYVYVSSRSVYVHPAPADADEDAPVVDGDPDAGEGDYPANKAGAEQAVLAAFGDRALLCRAGLILGPGEDVGRLPWWLSRIARGGTVPAPGPPELGLQLIDARDLASWALSAAERGLVGAFNAVSAPGHATMRELLESCVDTTGSDAELRWLEPEAVLAAGVEPWTQLPVWLPPGELHDALHRGDVSRALAAGLRCRPIADTVADTWAWLAALSDEERAGIGRSGLGLEEDAEAGLLAAG
jgi:2'-hydroxyisoflavone reductase